MDNKKSGSKAAKGCSNKNCGASNKAKGSSSSSSNASKNCGSDACDCKDCK